MLARAKSTMWPNLASRQRRATSSAFAVLGRLVKYRWRLTEAATARAIGVWRSSQVVQMPFLFLGQELSQNSGRDLRRCNQVIKSGGASLPVRV